MDMAQRSLGAPERLDPKNQFAKTKSKLNRVLGLQRVRHDWATELNWNWVHRKTLTENLEEKFENEEEKAKLGRKGKRITGTWKRKVTTDRAGQCKDVRKLEIMTTVSTTSK